MTTPRDEIRRRLAEQILGDESLTDELDDDDAEVLINWGLAQVEAISTHAVAQHAPPSDASDTSDASDPSQTPPETQAQHVRKIMKRISRLVGRRARLATEELEAQLAQLVQLAQLAQMGAPLQKAPSPPITAPEAPVQKALSARELANARISNQEIITRLLAMSLNYATQQETPADEQKP